MKWIKKIVGTLVVLALVALAVLAYVLAYDAGPSSPTPLAAQATPMSAMVYRQYGGPAVMHLETVARPTPADNELLIKVRAASINPLDWHYLRGLPYLIRPSRGVGRPGVTGLGVDFAGTVEAVGKSVTQFKVGDALFGTADKTLAQYATTTEVGLARIPTNMSFEQAAAVPIAGLTALQGLRDVAALKPGQRVLINGASGGVGTFAVQIAKSFGAEVTGVCSTRNVALVRSIGADRVIDYTREDVFQSSDRYDVVLDTVGNRPLLDYRRIMTPKGVLVVVGGPSTNPWLGPMVNFLKARLINPFVSQRYVTFLADANRTEDLQYLAHLMQSGKLTPVIDRRYPLAESAQAMAYLELGHARGKIIIDVDSAAVP